MSVQELSERFLQFTLNEYPEFATYKGFRLQEDKLDIVSLDLYRRRGEFCQNLLDDCLEIKEDELSRSDGITLAVLKHIASTVTGGLKFENHLMAANFFEGPHVHFSGFAMQYMILKTVQDFKNYLSRLRSVPLQVDGRMGLLKEGLRKGIVPHKDVVLPRLESSLSKDLVTSPEEIRFFSRLKEMPSDIPQDECEKIRKEALCIIREEILPSFEKLLNFLKEEYFPKLTRETIGINTIPGPPRYETMLQFHCDVSWGPEKIHQIGLDMVKKYKEKICKIMTAQSFEGSMVEFSDYLAKRTDLNFEKTEDIVPYCRKMIEERILPKLPQMFHMPKETPMEFVEDNSPVMPARGFYNGPPLDNSKPAKVVLSVYNPTAYSKDEVMVLMLHETSPGHHFETCAMSMNDNLPTFRRLKDDRTYCDGPGKYPMNTAYTEGWGLYCESLGEELGLYENEFEEYWYLTYNLVRSGRAVCDTGINHFGWTREETVKYFEENIPLIPERRAMEILRYIACPGQGPSYMVGFINIKEMRDRAMDKLGPLFDIKDFHQLVLSEGKVSLSVLEKMVDHFIEDKLKSK